MAFGQRGARYRHRRGGRITLRRNDCFSSNELTKDNRSLYLYIIGVTIALTVMASVVVVASSDVNKPVTPSTFRYRSSRASKSDFQ